MLEIFLPGNLQRTGEGWKLSTRIRFVHTRYGACWRSRMTGITTPGAHRSARAPGFCHLRLFQASAGVLGDAGREVQQGRTGERARRLALRRLPHGNTGNDPLYERPGGGKIYKVGSLCEPKADADSVAVANLLIQSIPKVADVQDGAEQQRLVTLACRLSRALIGKSLADRFEFPRIPSGRPCSSTDEAACSAIGADQQDDQIDNFTQLLQISVYDSEGLSYKMPDHVYPAKSSPW